MPMETHSFRRLVLGLQPGTAGHSMQHAVDLADLLHLDLLGLLLEDTSLTRLANIPFAREFRSLGGGWHPISPEQLSHDFDVAARSVRRIFTETAKRLATTTCQFDIARGPTAEMIASISRADDIVMIIEPASPAERVTQQFSWLMQAAFRSAAAVVLTPRQVVRTKGPIVAIAAWLDDPSIRVAAAIAMAAKEELIVLDIGEAAMDSQSVGALAARLRIAVRHIVAGDFARLSPAACLQAIQPFQERLLVTTRGTFQNGDASAIAAARRIPVLVIEPPQAEELQRSSETATRESPLPRSDR